MFPRPPWNPLPLPAGQDPATAHDFQNLADTAHAGVDAGLSGIGRRLATASGALGPSQSNLVDAGQGISAFMEVATANDPLFNSLDPGQYAGALDAALSAIEQHPELNDTLGDSIPDASCLVPNFPAVPGFAVSAPPPALPAPSGDSTAAAQQVLWNVVLGTQILQIGLGTTAAAAFPGVAPAAISSLTPIAAGILPIIGAVALGAALPLLFLSLFGINLNPGPSPADIAFMERSDQGPIDQLVGYIAGSAWMFKPPYNAPYAPGNQYYDAIYGYLRLAVCQTLSFRAYWNQDWISGNLTKIAQAWTHATGRFPPEVSCVNWPH